MSLEKKHISQIHPKFLMKQRKKCLIIIVWVNLQSLSLIGYFISTK